MIIRVDRLLGACTGFLIISFCIACTGTISCAQETRTLFNHAIGVQAFTYRSSFSSSTESVLDTLKALGITELEGENPPQMNASVFKKLCDSRGISIPSIGESFDDLSKSQDSVIARAKTLGAHYVMSAWIPHKKEFTVEDAQKAAIVFNQAGKALKNAGLTFCYHIHGYEFGRYANGTLFDYLAGHTDPAFVSFEVDILWAFHGGQDPAAFIRKYGSRCKLLHLKDLRKGVTNDLSGATSTLNDVALGTGQLDIPGILKAAQKANIAHYFIEDESPAHAIQIPQTIAYLRSLKY